MFCKSLNSARARLARVSVRLGLIRLESRLGSGSFFSENESIVSASFTSLVSINKYPLPIERSIRNVDPMG